MDSPLCRKHVIFLGSSVTYGSASNGISFADYIAIRNGCSITKEAVSGTTLTDDEPLSYIERLKEIDTSVKADLFVCQLSTNDAAKGKPLGDVLSQDTSTVSGAIRYISGYVSEVWHCPVVFYTSPRFESEAYGLMVNALNKIAPDAGITVIDMWNDEAFNAARKDDYMADPIHPTEAGYRLWWTPYIEKKLSEIV